MYQLLEYYLIKLNWSMLTAQLECFLIIERKMLSQKEPTRYFQRAISLICNLCLMHTEIKYIWFKSKPKPGKSFVNREVFIVNLIILTKTVISCKKHFWSHFFLRERILWIVKCSSSSVATIINSVNRLTMHKKEGRGRGGGEVRWEGG